MLSQILSNHHAGKGTGTNEPQKLPRDILLQDLKDAWCLTEIFLAYFSHVASQPERKQLEGHLTANMVLDYYRRLFGGILAFIHP